MTSALTSDKLVHVAADPDTSQVMSEYMPTTTDSRLCARHTGSQTRDEYSAIELRSTPSTSRITSRERSLIRMYAAIVETATA
eukprot:4459666-Prymnesium_polylepis.1